MKDHSKNRPYVPFSVGDEVWVVHPTEIRYRWVIDGPLTVKEVIRVDARVLYKFEEMYEGPQYVGYTADRVFSTFQDAVSFRVEMLRSYPHRVVRSSTG